MTGLVEAVDEEREARACRRAGASPAGAAAPARAPARAARRPPPPTACSAPLIARYTPVENTGSRNAKASPTSTQPGPAHASRVVGIVARDPHLVADELRILEALPQGRILLQRLPAGTRACGPCAASGSPASTPRRRSSRPRGSGIIHIQPCAKRYMLMLPASAPGRGAAPRKCPKIAALWCSGFLRRSFFLPARNVSRPLASIT